MPITEVTITEYDFERLAQGEKVKKINGEEIIYLSLAAIAPDVLIKHVLSALEKRHLQEKTMIQIPKHNTNGGN